MIERIKELLIQQNIINAQAELLPISLGSGGAHIFSVDEKYIIKYAYFPELEFAIRKQFINEYNFYKYYANDDLIPEIVWRFFGDDEILLVMKKYSPIKIEEWTEDLQKSAMELYASINALDTKYLAQIFQAEKEAEQKEQKDGQEDSYPLSKSYENWQRLQIKFPEYIDNMLLKEMYQNFDKIDSNADKIYIPATLCQGDFHPENVLKDGGKLRLCDWQNVGIGKGIADVAFFISRGADMGLKIDRDNLIKWYAEAFYKYTNLKIEINDFYKHIAASEFGVSFRFWAEYLQESNIDRVMNIYNSMVNSYRFLLSK